MHPATRRGHAVPEWEGAGSNPPVGGVVSGWYTLLLDDGSEVGAASRASGAGRPGLWLMFHGCSTLASPSICEYSDEFLYASKASARQAAQQTANQAKDTAVRAVESLAEDFLEAAEGALQQAQAERGLQAESAETSEPAEEQTRSLHEERMDRKRRAAESWQSSRRFAMRRTTDRWIFSDGFPGEHTVAETGPGLWARTGPCISVGLQRKLERGGWQPGRS